MRFTVTGDKEIDRMLRQLEEREADRALNEALEVGGRTALRSMKAHVPARYKDAKKALDMRFRKKKRRNHQGITVGAGVGRLGKVRSRSGRPGVGITKETIHWFLHGTGRRRTKAGKNRGKMPPVLHDVVEKGFEAAEPSVKQEMLAVIRRRIEQAVG